MKRTLQTLLPPTREQKQELNAGRQNLKKPKKLKRKILTFLTLFTIGLAGAHAQNIAITSLPATLTVSGKYYLTTDLTGYVNIEADNIILGLAVIPSLRLVTIQR